MTTWILDMKIKVLTRKLDAQLLKNIQIPDIFVADIQMIWYSDGQYITLPGS